MLQCHNHSVVWRSIADLIGLLQCIRILCDSAVEIGRCTGKVSECSSSSSSLFQSWIEVSLSRISHIVSLTLSCRLCHWLCSYEDDFESLTLFQCQLCCVIDWPPVERFQQLSVKPQCLHSSKSWSGLDIDIDNNENTSIISVILQLDNQNFKHHCCVLQHLQLCHWRQLPPASQLTLSWNWPV